MWNGASHCVARQSPVPDLSYLCPVVLNPFFTLSPLIARSLGGGVLPGLGASCWRDGCEWVWGQQLEFDWGRRHRWPLVTALAADGGPGAACWGSQGLYHPQTGCQGMEGVSFTGKL